MATNPQVVTSSNGAYPARTNQVSILSGLPNIEEAIQVLRQRSNFQSGDSIVPGLVYLKSRRGERYRDSKPRHMLITTNDEIGTCSQLETNIEKFNESSRGRVVLGLPYLSGLPQLLEAIEISKDLKASFTLPQNEDSPKHWLTSDLVPRTCGAVVRTVNFCATNSNEPLKMSLSQSVISSKFRGRYIVSVPQFVN